MTSTSASSPTRPNPLQFSRKQAMEIAKFVLNHPDADIVPPLSQQQDLPSIRRRFAEAVREEMERRKKTLKIMTYDDVLLRLRRTLLDEVRGPVACARLRERYDVVLVDEFQDTDPVQWDIMHRAFGQGEATLVLIGDPKQAIYTFRGADVHAYLDANKVVQSEWTLDINWRSDQGLLEAYDALFADAQLGYADIAYRPIHAADAHQESRLVDAPEPAPLRFRMVHASDGLVPLTARKAQPKMPDTRALIARDLAADVVQTLDARPQIVTRRRDGTETERTTLHPGHIAVLVRTNSQATMVRDALQAAGVPAVIGGSGSVFATAPAQEWLQLLEALERPTARDRASLVALTRFVGWTAEEVASASEEAWEDLHWSLHQWAALLRDQGIASLFETVSSARDVPRRVLERSSGERFMTDLRHIAQLLHEAGVSEGLGPTAMATWLGRRIHDAARDAENEERARRLESDAEAVQVITIHRSKGLEFPIVYCPATWDGRGSTSEVPVFHDPSQANRRTIDVAHEGNEFNKHQKLELEEGRGEDLRLLYVALTRARHQAIVWWAGAMDSQHSPLARLLFDRDTDGLVPPYGAKVRSDDEVEAAARALGQRVAVERVGPPPAVHWHVDRGAPPRLEAARFDRSLDTEWRRASYSSITAASHDQPAIGSEPEQRFTSDEQVLAPVVLDEVAPTLLAEGARAVALGLADMPGGALVGTVVHSVFERLDFEAPELPSAVGEALERETTWRNVDLGGTDAAVAGLCRAIASPLGPLADGIALRDITRRDRLDELTFEIPLVGGDTPVTTLHVGALADLLESHLPAQDPVARYASRLRDPSLHAMLRGYLTGSLDLVFRLPGDRFVLADYKTNRLGAPDEMLTAWHYRPEALQAEMVAAHYPLQAVLYSVALHRYLRWRLPGYEPKTHLGGVLYLFVRGMSAMEPTFFDDQPCGVWSWRPPGALVTALSDLFDRGAP